MLNTGRPLLQGGVSFDLNVDGSAFIRGRCLYEDRRLLHYLLLLLLLLLLTYLTLTVIKYTVSVHR